MVKKVGKYEIGKTIGEGTFGKVKLAVNMETGEKMAIKVSGWVAGCISVLVYTVIDIDRQTTCHVLSLYSLI